MRNRCRKFSLMLLICLAACGSVEQSEQNIAQNEQNAEFTSVVITQNRDASLSVSDGTHAANCASLKTDFLPQIAQTLKLDPDGDEGFCMHCDNCTCTGTTCTCTGCSPC